MKESYKFVNKELGNIRTLEDNGSTWFIAKDICSIITSVPVASVLKRVSEENKAKLNLGLGGKYTNVVNTDGLFQILDGGQTEKARILKQWIVSEVLPSLEEEADMTVEEEDMVPFEETGIPFDEVDDCFTPAIHEEPSTMEDEIDLTIIEGQIMVSSLEVAEKFEKNHRDVLETIRNLTAQNSAVKIMFKKSQYTNSRGRKYDEFLMNRDGFSLLCMGFTGKKALDWKLKYINAFNQMEERLKSGNVLTDEEKLKLQLFSSDPSEVAYAHAQLLKLATAPLEKEICEQKVLIDEQKPLVTFATHVTKTSDTVDMGEFAKIVAKEKINVGRNRLFTWLREQGYLITNNVPYQRYINNGYFKVIEVSKITSYGKINVFPKTLVTGKGQIFLVERLREEFGMIA